MEQKSNKNLNGVVRNSGNVINKGMVNEQGTVLNRGQVSESQKELVRNDSGAEEMIRHQDDKVNQIFGNGQTVNSADNSLQDNSRQNENGQQQDSRPETPADQQPNVQEYNIPEQQSSASSYKNYSQRIRFENVQNNQTEQAEQTGSSGYDEYSSYSSTPVVLGQNDILPEHPQETFGQEQQTDYINYGVPETYGRESSYVETVQPTQNQQDYISPHVSASKQAYAEQVRESSETADRRSVRSYDNTKSVINQTDSSSLINPSDKSDVFRQKSADVSDVLKGQPLQNPNQDITGGDRQDSSKSYVSSSKKAYTSQIKEHKPENGGGMVKAYDSAESVINKSDGSSVINSSDKPEVFRQRSADITSFKDSSFDSEAFAGTSESSYSQSAALERQDSSKPYDSASKKAYTSQIKERQTENGGGMVKAYDSAKAVVNQADSSSVINSSDNSSVFRQRNSERTHSHDSDVQDYNDYPKYGQDFNTDSVNQSSSAISENEIYSYNSNKKTKKNYNKSVYGRERKNNKEPENSAENRHSENEYTVNDDRDEKTFSHAENRSEEHYDNGDSENEPYTFREKGSSYSDFVNYKGGEVKNDISKFSADNDIVETDYSSLFTKNSKELVKSKDSEKESEQSAFSKSVHKKTVKDLINKDKNSDIIKSAEVSAVIHKSDNLGEARYISDKSNITDNNSVTLPADSGKSGKNSVKNENIDDRSDKTVKRNFTENIVREKTTADADTGVFAVKKTDVSAVINERENIGKFHYSDKNNISNRAPVELKVDYGKNENTDVITDKAAKKNFTENIAREKSSVDVSSGVFVVKENGVSAVINERENTSEFHYSDKNNITKRDSVELTADYGTNKKTDTNPDNAVKKNYTENIAREKTAAGAGVFVEESKSTVFSSFKTDNGDSKQSVIKSSGMPVFNDKAALPFYYKEKVSTSSNNSADDISAAGKKQKERKENKIESGKTGKKNGNKDSNKKNEKNAVKSKPGLARFSTDAAKNAVLEEIKGSDESLGTLIGAAAAAERILKPGSIQNRTTKGDFRRPKSKAVKKAGKAGVFTSAVKNSGKNLMKDTVKLSGTVTKNTVLEGGSLVKNSIFNAVSENADSSMGINAVDVGIKTVDKASSAVRGTQSAIRTGKKTVKAVKSAPKKTFNGAKQLKAMSKRLYKFARMKRNQQIKIIGKGMANLGRMAVSAAVNLVMTILSAVAGFFMPILLIALVIFVVISAVVSIIPAISLKADDYELTKAWEYITEKDADTEIEYKTKYTDYPENYQCYTFVEVNKYFAVNGSEVVSETEQQYSFLGIHGSSDLYHPVSSDTSINNTSLKTNADAFLVYLDAKFEDYKFDDIQTDIDNFYDQIVRVQYVDNEDNPSTKTIGSDVYHVFYLNVNLHYDDAATYIQNNKDTLFTDNEAEAYDLLYEVGQYLTRIELSKPIETEDESIACQKRYGYYVDKDTTTKKFHSGIDITASPGTNVLSPISGKINSVDGSKIEIYNKSDKRIITITNVTGITVSAGSTVNTGDVLGTVDSNGYICLEYKVKGALSDTYLNPSFYIDNLVYTNNSNSSVMYDSAIDLSNYVISDELTGTARSVVEAALSMVGSTGYTNSCAKAVSTIYQMAGLGYHGGNGNDFSRANKLVVSGGSVDYTKIPVGAYIGIKYGTGNAGYLYGHVGVYVGLIGGVPSVVQGGSDAIAITSLDHFYEYFITNNANSVYGNDIGWNISSTNGSVSPLYFES